MRNPRTTLLASVSGELVSGELTAILGQSGAGKSTMLRALAQAPMPLGIDINGAVLADGKLVLGRMSDAYVMSEEEGISLRESSPTTRKARYTINR